VVTMIKMRSLIVSSMNGVSGLLDYFVPPTSGRWHYGMVDALVKFSHDPSLQSVFRKRYLENISPYRDSTASTRSAARLARAIG
jgi:hypothetical protein